MPRSWPRKPDRKTDPEFRRADDRMNFIVHVMAFLAINSGIWFFDILKQAELSWPVWFSLGWLGILMLNLIYIAAIADYTEKSNG
ncbi:MAG: 2TM domain-containing protein [Limnothrix sp. RL_2_0]|nr:2TM domain-containing protein [Limnothrix sp. RL_2_0]